ncbi:hypothetical protein Lal_00000805 [Lupinus albus]|nr:hypothetical protein Lal_00000805 [Lupinus albus]
MNILSAGYLTLEDRLVHYFLTYVIFPKFSNHSQISDIELHLMYAIKYNIKINWAKMIMQQMWHVRGSQSPLPYAIFITKILEHFGVSLDGETKVALNLRESKVDVEVVHKMGFVIDPVTRRTYKHRTDRQTAPTDEPEPTAPNEPESHAPSSSSSTMPTNQMIMDELVSLRGYITTRMDAFDTQSQQIYYELHCLSSRLSNMDVYKDSSDPEHITPKERGSIHIGGTYSRQVKIYHPICCSQNNTPSRKYWFVIIKKGEIVKKILLLTLTGKIGHQFATTNSPLPLLVAISFLQAFISQSAINYTNLAHVHENSKSYEDLELEKVLRKKFARKDEEYDSLLGVVREIPPELILPDNVLPEERVLILSEFVGAAQSLGVSGNLVNPWNITEAAITIAKAMNMPSPEREKRHRRNFHHPTLFKNGQKWLFFTFLILVVVLLPIVPPESLVLACKFEQKQHCNEESKKERHIVSWTLRVG